MAKLTTLTQLIDRIRFQGDFENSRVMSDARITEVINASIEGLWDLMLDARPDNYISRIVTSTGAGVETLALPSDFYRLCQIEINDGSRWLVMRPHNLSEAWRYQNAPATAARITYRIQGGVIYFAPIPTASYQLRVYYFPPASDLVAGSDTLDGVNGYDDLVIAQTVAKLRGGREGMDSSWWDREAARMESDIRKHASPLDVGEPFALSGQAGYGPDAWDGDV